jgi:hypothetical protein
MDHVVYFYHPIFMSYLTFFFVHVTIGRLCLMRKTTYWMRSHKILMKWIKGKRIAAVRNKTEDLIQRAKSSHEGMDFLVSSVMNIDTSFDHIAPSLVQAPQEEYEGFISCKISEQIKIHPPPDIQREGAKK